MNLWMAYTCNKPLLIGKPITYGLTASKMEKNLSPKFENRKIEKIFKNY